MDKQDAFFLTFKHNLPIVNVKETENSYPVVMLSQTTEAKAITVTFEKKN